MSGIRPLTIRAAGPMRDTGRMRPKAIRLRRLLPPQGPPTLRTTIWPLDTRPTWGLIPVRERLRHVRPERQCLGVERGGSWRVSPGYSYRGQRGGSFGNIGIMSRSSTRVHGETPTIENFDIGFRVTEVPEPASIIALLGWLAGVLGIRRRKV